MRVLLWYMTLFVCQDMTVRLWEPESGRQLACCPVDAEGSDSSDSDQKVAVVGVFAVQAGSDCLLVVQVHRYVPAFRRYRCAALLMCGTSTNRTFDPDG